MTDRRRSNGIWSVLAPADQALFQAIAEGDMGAVESAVAQGADPNIRDKDGETPVHVAAHSDHRALRLLFSVGADPNVRGPQGMTPLHMAFDPATINELLINGADPERTDDHGNRPLHYLVADGDADSLAALMSHGVDVTARGGEGWRPDEHIQALATNHPGQDWWAIEALINSENARRSAVAAAGSPTTTAGPDDQASEPTL